MSTRSSNICQNCNTKNELSFKYCSNCGQKNTDGKITFLELWSEFKDSVLNIDSRTWGTFKNLFIPGKLTLEYFSGKHRRYVHPLRLLLVTSVLVIIAMSFQGFQSTSNYRYDVKEWILKNYERQNLYRILGNIAENTNAVFPEQQTEIITDTILSSFKDSLLSLVANYKYRDGYGNSVNLNKYYSLGSDDPEIVSKHDFLNMNEDELVEKYKKDAGSFDRFVFKQKLKLMNGSQIFAAIIGHITWAALLMMPFLALVLYFLNIRHNYYFIEHLIFTFHLNAFLFLMIAILIGGMHIFPMWIFYMFIAIILIYVFVSFWKVYSQSVGKTFLKLFFFSISYVSLLFLFFLATFFFSFFLL